jgi:hypothetical protein
MTHHQKPNAETSLHIQHLLMSLAIRETHTFARCKIVHNFLLEKIPGIPLITKLRVIHIYKADWSLIQRLFVAHNINNVASRCKTVAPEQAGGRPGRSSIELAINIDLTYETIQMQRFTGAAM